MELNAEIKGIFLNQNNTLFAVAQEDGFEVYETYNFKKVSDDDDFKDLIVYF